MSQIDSELNILREKLASLEDQKKEEQMKYDQIEQETKKVFYKNNPIITSLTKYSKEDLLQLKAKKNEENRISRITEIIKMIYSHVIQTANNNLVTKYEHCIGQWYNNLQVTNEFYITNKIEIICNLQHIFPGCDIKYITLDKILDPYSKKLCDIDNLHSNLQRLNENQLKKYETKSDYLVIDWS
jgi:hypothetical protein